MHMEIINGILRILNNKLNAEDLLRSVVDQVATKLNCDHCTLFEYSQDIGKLIPRVVSGDTQQIIDRHFNPGEGIAGWVFKNGETLITPDATNDHRFAPSRTNRVEHRSMLAAPVKIGKRTIGVICADQDEYEWMN